MFDGVSLERIAMDLAARQHGVVARRQLFAAGYSAKTIRRRIQKGILLEVTPRVLTVAGVPNGRGRRAMTAVLHAGEHVVLSHTSAAAWWRISGFRLEPIHVAIERNRHWEARDGMIVHHATVLPTAFRTVLDAIPITTPALTILHLAGMISPERLEAAVDHAWSLRLIDGADLAEVLDRMAQRGRNGVAALRTIAGARPATWTPPQSNLESRFLQLTKTHSLGRFECQVVLQDDGWQARVDFVDRDVPLVVEVQSQRYHAALSQRSRDAERRRRIESLGYTVVEVWDVDLFGDEERVASRVRSVRRHLLSTSPRSRDPERPFSARSR